MLKHILIYSCWYYSLHNVRILKTCPLLLCWFCNSVLISRDTAWCQSNAFTIINSVLGDLSKTSYKCSKKYLAIPCLNQITSCIIFSFLVHRWQTDSISIPSEEFACCQYITCSCFYPLICNKLIEWRCRSARLNGQYMYWDMPFNWPHKK